MISPQSEQQEVPRLYRLRELIYMKAATEGKARKTITQELYELLDISRDHLYKIIGCRADQDGYLSIPQLIQLAGYFSVGLDDLINKDLQTPEPIPGRSDMEAGDSFDD